MMPREKDVNRLHRKMVLIAGMSPRHAREIMRLIDAGVAFGRALNRFEKFAALKRPRRKESAS